MVNTKSLMIAAAIVVGVIATLVILTQQNSGTNSDTVILYPTFTNAAYSTNGFYSYYRGECDEKCLTVYVDVENSNRYNVGKRGFDALKKLGYPHVTDIEVDENLQILEKYSRVILLHNEYITQKEFDAITNHPFVIYLYPNALYAKVDYDKEKRTITLIRGHNYPTKDISNGFDWELDNTRYEKNCVDELNFYQVKNGYMTNCYPEHLTRIDPDFLKEVLSKL
ncbi:MAG: hypothetical protein ACREAE_00660 [Nitrosopumilaceae archaeon]